MHTFKMSFDQAVLIHQVVDSHTQTLKNWIASAVESGDIERANHLVAELREYQTLFAAFNLKSRQETSRQLNRPMPTEHFVKTPIRPLTTQEIKDVASDQGFGTVDKA